MKIKIYTLASLLVVLLWTDALSQVYKPFPGESADQRTFRTQERVEELYSSGDYSRAMYIYENELAPLGDKYAQYMVGYMHLNAQSVPQDKTKALAWYRLAAERGERVLLQARDHLIASMTEPEIRASDIVFVDLWRSIGDTKLVVELIRKDMNTLRSRTGSRIPGSTESGPTVIFRRSGEQLGPNFYRNIRVRLEARLKYLETRVEVSDLLADVEIEDTRVLEQQVREELAALGQP